MVRDGSSCIVVMALLIGGLSVFGNTFAKVRFVSAIYIYIFYIFYIYIFYIVSYTESWLNCMLYVI